MIYQYPQMYETGQKNLEVCHSFLPSSLSMFLALSQFNLKLLFYWLGTGVYEAFVRLPPYLSLSLRLMRTPLGRIFLHLFYMGNGQHFHERPKRGDVHFWRFLLFCCDFYCECEACFGE